MGETCRQNLIKFFAFRSGLSGLSLLELVLSLGFWGGLEPPAIITLVFFGSFHISRSKSEGRVGVYLCIYPMV